MTSVRKVKSLILVLNEGGVVIESEVFEFLLSCTLFISEGSRQLFDRGGAFLR